MIRTGDGRSFTYQLIRFIMRNQYDLLIRLVICSLRLALNIFKIQNKAAILLINVSNNFFKNNTFELN